MALSACERNAAKLAIVKAMMRKEKKGERQRE